jgi:hypothetical protein
MELETPKNKAFEATTGNLVVGVRPFAKPLFGGSNPPAASSWEGFERGERVVDWRGLGFDLTTPGR